MNPSDEMNVYCISRTSEKTFCSAAESNESSFTLLKDIWDTPHAHQDFEWENPEAMASLRRELGVESAGRCYITYRYDSRSEGTANRIKAAMEAAGFPNVHMVADVDAVMAYYEHEEEALSCVGLDESVIVTTIRPYDCGSDYGPQAILYATLCRPDLRETKSVYLCKTDDGMSYDFPMLFFDSLHDAWAGHNVAAIMYHGYYPLFNQMRDMLALHFPDAYIHSSWYETIPSGKLNLQHGLEWMVPALERSRSILNSWMRCTDTHDCPESTPVPNLINHLDEAFRTGTLPELKKLSDLGDHAYGALRKWVRSEQVCCPDGKLRRMNKSMLSYQAKRSLAESFKYRRDRFMENVLPQTAGKAAEAVISGVSIPGTTGVSAEEICKKLTPIFAGCFSADVHGLLETRLNAWWNTCFALLEEGVFVNRARQIRNLSDRLNQTRLDCRRSVLGVLAASCFDLEHLRTGFIRTVLESLRESLQADLMKCFHPATVESASIKPLSAVPNACAMDRRFRGNLGDDLAWDDSNEYFDPVIVQTPAPSVPCGSDGAYEGDNYVETLDGTITYYWEYID